MSLPVSADPALANISRVSSSFAVPFRHRRVDGMELLTNEVGDWIFLKPEDLTRYVEGKIKSKEPLYEELKRRRFIASDQDDVNLAEAYGRRISFVRTGPHLHIVVVTLRCDHTCLYCQASRAPMDAHEYDMTKETAERVIDLVLASPNEHLTIEFQGGEPLANFEIVKYIIETAKARNELARRRLAFALVSSLSLMTDEILDYLIEHKVEICTSLDGPEDLHDDNRRLKGGGSYKRATKWIARINDRYEEAGLDPDVYRVESILTVTKGALDRPEDIVKTYVDAGCRAIFLRPLSPFGFAVSTAKKIGYEMEDWLKFYRRAVDHIIELNRKGIDILERTAAIFLTKILTGDDPNYLDIRSPCGAAIGQVAYGHDGGIYTCDEGRMVHQMGDDIFRIGDVRSYGYRDIMSSPTVSAMAVASTLDAQPDCIHCVYKPYCGTCPVHSYSEQGSLFGRMRDSSYCAKHKGIQDYLFTLLHKAQDDPELESILRRWTIARSRPHFVHEPKEGAQSDAAPAEEESE